MRGSDRKMYELPSTILEYFPQTMQISKPSNFKKLNFTLLAAINEICQTTPNSKPRHWAGNLYTTARNRNQLMEEPSFRELADFITEEIEIFASKFCINKNNGGLFINNMWINKLKNKDSMDQHCHPNSLFTGVYFVKVPQNSGLLAFDSPLSEQMITPPIKISNQYNMRQAGFKMSEGDLIIFNSHLKHRVLLHNVDEERISIGFTCAL